MELKRLVYTVVNLKVSQLAYQIWYRLPWPKIIPEVDSVSTAFNTSEEWPSFKASSTKDCFSFRFLNQSGDLSDGWNSCRYEKLWLYNLHYLDDLNALSFRDASELKIELLNEWIIGNPPLVGNGWEPYPLSLRLVNLVKFMSSYEDPELEWIKSAAQQAEALLRQREFHILGNHIFANGKALVFAGSYIQSSRSNVWFFKGLEILDAQIPEQFLEDGAHFELSPMYHALQIWDVCDLIFLSMQAGNSELNAREEEWREVVRKGISWLRAMVHPDLEIPFFNDSAFGISPSLKQLESYAEKVGGLPSERCIEPSKYWSYEHLICSGYVVVRNSTHFHHGVLDLARVGPDYQPGHAHADTLSFELSLFGQRLFVNSGTSQYGIGPERDRQRGTRSHNTVEVDDEDSSEVWAGFRVARRAQPKDVSVTEANEQVIVRGAHDGYRRLKGKVSTTRTWRFRENYIEVRDELSGAFSGAVSRFYCHPDVTVEKVEGTSIELTLPHGQKIVLLAPGAFSVNVLQSSWHPFFGQSVPNRCIEITLSGPSLVSKIIWEDV